MSVVHMAAQLLADVPDIGGGTAPPGSDKLLTLARWILWIVSGLSVVGLLLVAGRMVVAHNHGEWGQHGQRLGAVMFGIILIGSASGIAGALI